MTDSKENRYTQIPNEIMEAFARININGEAMRILLIIIRKTYGFHKRWDYISLSQFAASSGLKKPNIVRAINKLKELNLIIIETDNDGLPKYRLNKDFESWKPLSKPITLSKPIIKLSEPITEIIEMDNDPLSKPITTKENTTKETITKKNTLSKNIYIKKVFSFWNEQQFTITHKVFSERMKNQIKIRLREYSVEDIISAIKNYNFILGSSRHYYSHRFTLYEFIKQENAMPRFLDEAEPKHNFLNRELKTHSTTEEKPYSQRGE